MLVHPRVALASGLAAAAGLALLIVGRVEGTVVTAVALAVAARAAALASSRELHAPRALARVRSSVPVWVGVAVVGSLRAGSADLADIAGAHAVAGVGVLHGSPGMVAASWLAAAAAALAIAMPSAGGEGSLAAAVSEPPYRRLEAIAVALQGLLAVAIVTGPQVDGTGDLVPWLAGGAVAAAVILASPRIARRNHLPVVALSLVVLGVLLAILGDRP